MNDIEMLEERPLAPADEDAGYGRWSRRRLLAGGGALLSAFWGGSAQAQQTTATPLPLPTPTSPNAWLVRRLTMGLTTTELNRVNSLGYDGYLEYQLNHLAIDDSALNARLAAYTTLTMQPSSLYPLPQGQIVTELQEALVLRAVLSQRQLFERMVEFWTDHFNIDINNGDDRYLKTVDDRDVIRANALGTFPGLLSASAHSPAMLLYLDNNTSVVGNPNENYARELMELHTLGVDGGYTQQDVVEVARCFTGWTLYNRNAGANSGLFRYNAAAHDNGQKVVLGHVIPPGGGMNDGLAVLNILTAHPSTARFIATKLTKWFCGYNPPPALINAVAATYTATNGDIKSMLRTMFRNRFVAIAQQTQKYKRPFHLFVSALRALNANVVNSRGIRTSLQAAGMLPYYWGPPDGYPDTLEFWSGLILPRWNFGAQLLASQVVGASVDASAFFSGATTAAQMAERINQNMFGGNMPALEQDRIRQYLLPDPPSTTRRSDALGLAIAAPSFQWY